ncbi:hypothetical protein vBBak6_058 [Bacillus phage v_B-Bak6]|uniref:Uncharacterized protein n=1 Tax=Bacillus phage Basilisk TaxID=1296654 RepID=S5MS54_9CAUD|nr:hypothetical protein PP653_gp100 [Bacillus phage Basilisk]AGR46612.1 hypothetical protein BASILISK_67 [Bacillus phage Basilisk]AXY83018.1 hypothetical protein vBBak1_058 [Bacillus phage v_B-Bak1]AXY83138.1 hypothetical protein vBBak6_058 [Bacillus phage v_B-Bak6]
MENKVTFTKAELFILIGGTVLAWDGKVGIEDEVEELEQRLEKILNNEDIKETEESFEFNNQELEKEINESKTYIKALNKLLDLYEGSDE